MAKKAPTKKKKTKANIEKNIKKSISKVLKDSYGDKKVRVTCVVQWESA